MKNLLFYLLLWAGSAVAQNVSNNISLLGKWSDPTVPAEPVYKAKYNSVFGYHDSVKNKEYAIIGSSWGTYVIDVTNPASPVKSAFVKGRRSGCIWREYRTYGKYLYAISDDTPSNSMQIIDMSYLPDSIHVVYDSDTAVTHAHTIFIEGDKMYLANVGTPSNYYGMAVYSLANPENPQLLRALPDDGYTYQVHDMLVRHDTIYASCGYSGLIAFKFANNAFSMLGSLTAYIDMGYNHSSALSPDGKTLFFTDEVPAGQAVKVADISDLQDIKIHSHFYSNEGATPHNPYWVGKNKVVLSYYQDGVQIYDVSDPKNPLKVGFYDTYHQNTGGYINPAYSGCWGAYCDLPSGNIVASDMQNGLFVLDATNALNAVASVEEREFSTFSASPNPTKDFIKISSAISLLQKEVRILDIKGALILQQMGEGNEMELDLRKLSKGIYFLRIYDEKEIRNFKIIKE